jgi:protein involved in polysaccharide export with SLBB domain
MIAMLSLSAGVRACKAVLAVAVLTITAAPAAVGQILPQAPQPQVTPPPTPTTDPLESDPALQEWSSITAGGGPYLDRAIDRNEYRLGPGDIVTLSILGYSDRIFRVAVTPEGSVVIPTVGVSTVGGLTVEEAEQRISRDVRRFYAGADVALSLTSVRTFKVFLVGAVENPGVRLATSVTRVSELIPRSPDDGPIRRTAVIRRGDGDTIRVDLVRFQRTGDLSLNPVLREGDAIHVSPLGETVRLSGELSFPGTYEYLPGESLAELLSMANGYGPFPPRASEVLWLRRFHEEMDEDIVRISRADAVGAVGQGIQLEPFDAVFVPILGQYRQQTAARVSGEVLRPGIYPVQPNVTTVLELVQMAGGFTDDASLVDAVLRRQPMVHPRDSLRLLENIPPELLTEEDRRILQVTRRADDQNVVLDFAQLFSDGGEAYDVRIMDGDNLLIPSRRDEVIVLGAVVQPGIVSYLPGEQAEHFIDLAGGYSKRADVNDVVILKARMGTRLRLDESPSIEPGDRIIIPFRESMTLLERVASAQGVVNTVSGIILTVVGLERLWDRITR